MEPRRLLAPAVFLLAVTIAVIVARAGLNHDSGATTQQVVPPPVRHRVVTTTTPKRRGNRTARFYTVVAGDTFGVIASKTGVDAARIQQLNPKVSPTALVIGQKLRVR